MRRYFVESTRGMVWTAPSEDPFEITAPPTLTVPDAFPPIDTGLLDATTGRRLLRRPESIGFLTDIHDNNNGGDE